MLQLLFRNVSVIFPVNISNTQTINGGKFVLYASSKRPRAATFHLILSSKLPQKVMSKMRFLLSDLLV